MSIKSVLVATGSMILCGLGLAAEGTGETVGQSDESRGSLLGVQFSGIPGTS
jgi:hypothetical protein